MNIHFSDKKLLNSLNDRTIFSIEVGSTMYNLNNNKSDVDMLNIYIEDEYNKNSFMWEHHQLQYKEINIDYNFSTLQGFIRNALTGDATINVEVIFSDKLKNTELQFLYDNRHSFLTYNVLKSYLGLAKRDLKMLLKSTKNLKAFTDEDYKKLSHFVRGVWVAENILLNNEINLSSTQTKILRAIKNGEFLDKKTLISNTSELMDDTRKSANIFLDKREISKFMNSNIMKIIDDKVKELSAEYKNDTIIDYGNLFYNAVNGVEY